MFVSFPPSRVASPSRSPESPTMLLAWLARLTAPLVLASPTRVARKLFDFARAEEESRLELHAALQRSPCVARRALYLRHALDEQRHCRMFERRSRELLLQGDRTPLGRPDADCEQLYARYGEVGFLAYVHLGEARGRQQFEAYVHALRVRDPKTSALFERIVVDERRHEEYTHILLRELLGSDSAVRRALWTARRRDAWRRWLVLGRGLTQPLYRLLMSVLYLSLLPIALVARARARRDLPRWTP